MTYEASLSADEAMVLIQSARRIAVRSESSILFSSLDFIAMVQMDSIKWGLTAVALCVPAHRPSPSVEILILRRSASYRGRVGR